MSELRLIHWLRRRIQSRPPVELGPGDDAAVIALQGRRAVVTTDAFLEGTHFAPGTEPERIGHKAIAASVSDIAAMGCQPTASFVALGINRAAGEDFVMRLSEGIIAAAEKYGAPVAGGDIASWLSPLCITVTVVGDPCGRKPVLRSGAREGDRIFVTGSLGGSLLGRHLEATPRVREGIFLNRSIGVTAMVDVSDGLSTDLGHIAEESGVGAIIRAADIPVSDAADALAARDGVSALRHALDDGEDFELLFTVPASRAARLRREWPFDLAIAEIGTMSGSGVRLEHPDGLIEPLEPHGYEHRWGD